MDAVHHGVCSVGRRNDGTCLKHIFVMIQLLHVRKQRNGGNLQVSI